MPNKKEIRQKILEATIICLERDGLANVTTRSIARQAGVNVAAINYYFGSKDNLIELSLEQTIQEAFVNNVEEFWGDPPTDEYKSLKEFLVFTFSSLFRFPNLSRVHLHGPLLNNDYSGIFPGRFTTFLKELLEKNRDILAPDEEAARFSLIQMFSAFFLPGLLPGLFQDFLQEDLGAAQVQERFIDFLLSRYLNGGNRE